MTLMTSYFPYNNNNNNNTT